MYIGESTNAITHYIFVGEGSFKKKMLDKICNVINQF